MSGINTNLAANGILANLSNTQSMFNTQVERLSSGLRINRAADDPAGLVISEKYRAQVDGLGQAIRNARDGINLSQTAEGALDEISNLLRQMRTLALHAANTGPNDSATIDADQKQIESAISTIDRIANTTQFGSKKLLDGSAGVTATSSSSNLTFVSGTSSVATGTKAVEVTTAAVKGSFTGAQLAVGTATGQNNHDITTAATATAAAGDTIVIGGSALSSAVTVTFAGTSVTEAAVLNEINTALGGQATASVSGGKLVFTATKLGASGSITAVASNADAAAYTGLSTTVANNTQSTASAGATSKTANAETLTFSNGAGSSVQVAVAAGTTLADVATNVQSALTSSGLKMSFSHSAGVFTVGNDEFGSSSTVKNTVSSTLTTTGINLVSSANSAVTVAGSTGAAGTNTAGKDAVGTIDGAAATGSGQNLSLNGLVVKATAAGSYTLTVSNNSMKMQIGAFADQTAELAIGDMRSNQLGNAATGVSSTTSSVNVASINVTKGSGAGAQDALRILDEAISQVSKQRASLGSFQKDTLEATVRNSLVAQQNIRTTESNIRDANVAEETLKFSKAQILQQTGIAMLAQANQAPQQLLALFR